NLHEVAHEVLDITADVAGLRELGRVGLHERHADEPGEVADEEGLADAGGAEQEEVRLLVGLLGEAGILEAAPHVVVVVAESDGEDALGLGLLYDIAVELVADFARAEVEGADPAQDFGAGGVL